MFINKAEVTSSNQVFAVGAGTPTGPTWGYLQGQVYQPQGNAMAVNSAAPQATDKYVGGMRFDSSGRLYVWPVSTLGVPPSIIYNQGLIFVPDGRLVVTANPATDWNGGWPLSQEGWVCMSLSGPAPPPAPGAFTFTATGGSTSPTPTLNWTASTDAASYTIYRDGVLQATVLAPITTWVQSPALPIGDVYSYTMFAVNATGTTASSSNPRSYSYQSLPGQPINVTAVAGNQSATVSFSPPLKDGNTGIFGYTATASPGGAFAQGSGSPIVIPGLVNGQTYTFTVQAQNSIGLGPPSAPSNPVTPAAAATVPVAPTIGTATATVPGQATVTFTPNGTGGSPILDYRITSSPGGIQQTVAGSPGVITGLTNNQAYTFTVQARNAIGYSLASAASNSATPPYQNIVPAAPPAPTAVVGAPGTGQATITFSAPAYNGGPPPTSYSVSSIPGGITNTGAVSPIVISGLTGGTSYTFTVTATNSVGTGLASPASNAVTPVTVPAAPVIGTATSPANGQLSITFVAPNNGGSPITSYTATTTPGGFTASGASSPILFTGLAANTYTVKVKATNAVGTGPESAASNAIAVSAGGPVPIFNAPLITTLVPTVAGGSNTPTFTRGTTAYVTDFEGILRQAVIGESRFQGARRVQNLAINSEVLTTAAGWTLNSITSVVGATDPLGGSSAYTLTATAPNGQMYFQSTKAGTYTGTVSWWIKRRTGSGTVQILGADGVAKTVPVTASWARYSLTDVGSAGDIYYGVKCLNSGDQIDVWHPQAEDVGGQTNQAPAEYVSKGVLAAPWHGANVDGVKYFATTNGNSVAGNVVTEAAGTAISTATMQGYIYERAATNLCLQSQTFGDAAWVKSNCTVTSDTIAAPDSSVTADTLTATAGGATVTQIVTGASAQRTLSVYLRRKTGTGQVQISLDGFSTAQTCVLTTAWQRFSVTGTVTNPNVGVRLVTSGDEAYVWGAQLEASTAVSSYIPTTTATVTRNIGLLTYVTSGNFSSPVGSAAAEVLPNSASDTVSTPLIGFTPAGINPLKYNGPIAGGAVNAGHIEGPANVYTSSNSWPVNTSKKIASRWGTLGCSVVVTGSAIGTNATTNALSTNPEIRLGFGTNLDQASFAMKNVQFYNVALTDAELIAITT